MISDLTDNISMNLRMNIIHFFKVYFIFSHCGLVSPLGVRGKGKGKRKSEMHPFFSILWFLLFSLQLNSQVVIASLNPDVRDKTELNIGFNRRSDNGNYWKNNAFISLLKDIDPEIIRYPGGTQANYWDWKTGKFIEGTNKIWGNKEVITIPDFVKALPDRSKIIYVLNMARPTSATGIDVNADERILKSKETLNLKIKNMLDAIAKFEEEGKSLYAVELGNEFYFGNIESGIFQIKEKNGLFYSGWNYSQNTAYISSSKREATEINAKFYLEQCNEIVFAIKNKYPDIKIALTTTKSGNTNSTRNIWNSTIFDQLRNNPVYEFLQENIFAVTQHHYINQSYGIQYEINDILSAKKAIAEGISYPVDRKDDYDMVPDEYKIWYTEIGESKRIAEDTWAAGLRYAAFMLSWMSLGDKVGQLDYQHITDNNVIKTGENMSLAPVGIAAKLLNTAMRNMEKFQEIDFDYNPVSVGGIKSLYGYKFKNNTKESLFIINIGDALLLKIDIRDLLDTSAELRLIQYYSSKPYISDVYEGHENIEFISKYIDSTFQVKDFSISVIETGNKLGNNQLTREKITISPNPVEDKLNILYDNNERIERILILDTKGNTVFIKNNPLNTINVSSFSPGVYFLVLKFKDKKIIKKFIKR